MDRGNYEVGRLMSTGTLAIITKHRSRAEAELCACKYRRDRPGVSYVVIPPVGAVDINSRTTLDRYFNRRAQ